MGEKVVDGAYDQSGIAPMARCRSETNQRVTNSITTELKPLSPFPP